MKHLMPKEAYQFMQETPNALLIDVRSEMEFLFVGHPVGAIMIPWNDGPDWDINPHFVAHVRKAASVEPPVGADLPQRQPFRDRRRGPRAGRLHAGLQRVAWFRG